MDSNQILFDHFACCPSQEQSLQKGRMASSLDPLDPFDPEDAPLVYGGYKVWEDAGKGGTGGSGGNDDDDCEAMLFLKKLLYIFFMAAGLLLFFGLLAFALDMLEGMWKLLMRILWLIGVGIDSVFSWIGSFFGSLFSW